MFAYVSKEVKAYMTIDNHSLHSQSYSPTKHIAEQTSAWQARWDPANHAELTNTINHMLLKLRRCGLLDQDTQKNFDATNLSSSLAGYTKETKGIDIWTPAELRQLPEYLQQLIAEAIGYSFKI